MKLTGGVGGEVLHFGLEVAVVVRGVGLEEDGELIRGALDALPLALLPRAAANWASIPSSHSQPDVGGNLIRGWPVVLRPSKTATKSLRSWRPNWTKWALRKWPL